MSLPPPDLPAPAAPELRPVPEAIAPPAAAPVANGPFNPYAPPRAPLQALPQVAKPEFQSKNVFEISGSLRDLLWESAAFPLRRNNRAVLVVGTLIITILALAAIVRPFGWAAVVIGAGYLSAYYFTIIEATVNGKFEAPPWPDWTDYWDDIFVPGAQMFVIAFVSSAPLLAASVYFSDANGNLNTPLLFAGTFFQWFYFPMATLAVVCHGSIWAALPHRVMPALIRCLPGYLICVGAIGLAEMLRMWIDDAMTMPFFSEWFISWALFVYMMIAQARLTALIFLRYREQLPWGR